MRSALTFAAAVLTGALAGCQYSFPLEISGPLAAPRVEVGRWGIVRQHEPCILWIRVSLEGSDPDRAIWEARSDRCQRIDLITYGQLPEGFAEVHPAEPLREGQVYRVSAMAPGGWGMAYVTFFRNGWRTVDAAWGDAS